MRHPKTFFSFRLWCIWLLLCLGCDQSKDYSAENRAAAVVEEEAATAENQYKVIAIKDGDTIELLKDGKPLRIRLQGVDCPEKNQDYGTRARQFTSDLVFGKAVELVVHDIDRYGRTVGEIILPDGRNLNQELVKNGFAWHYTAYSKDPELARLEAEARAKQRGLWEQPDPVAPWAFRKNRGAATPPVTAPAGTKPKKVSTAVAKTASAPSATISAGAGKVYLCESKSAKTYHRDRACHLFKQCRSSTGTVSLALARQDNRTACKVCAQ